MFVPSHSLHASLVSRQNNATAINCRAETIDNLVSTGRLRPPTTMKVDVEGAELAVFQGARDTIARHVPVILFEADENCRRFGYSPNDLCALLQELGDYEFMLIDKASDDPLKAHHLSRSPDMPEGDYLALPKHIIHRLSLLIFGWYAALDGFARCDAIADCIDACVG